MPKIITRLIPLLILALALAAYQVMATLAPEPASAPAKSPPLNVAIYTVRSETITLDVHTHGTVLPRTRTELAAEVTGRIIRVAPTLVGGGYVKRGEMLLEIDAVDYRAALARAKAELAATQRNLAEEQARTRQAQQDWQELGNGQPASPLAHRRPQLAESRAAVAAATAAVAQARQNLTRTRVLAPYDAMVKARQVDLGHYVMPGTPLAQLFAVDTAEVRLPITAREMAYLRLPRPGQAAGAASPRPRVVLSAEIAGQRHTWQGAIVRTEAVVDSTHRVFHTVARVDDPYGLQTSRLMPLAMGLFVSATIEGRILENAVRLPAHLIRENGIVHIVDPHDRIRFQTVKPLRRQGAEVILTAGLVEGDRVCATTVLNLVAGMQVRPLVPATDEAGTGHPPNHGGSPKADSPGLRHGEAPSSSQGQPQEQQS